MEFYPRENGSSPDVQKRYAHGTAGLNRRSPPLALRGVECDLTGPREGQFVGANLVVAQAFPEGRTGEHEVHPDNTGSS